MKSRKIEKNLCLEFIFTLMGIAYYDTVQNSKDTKPPFEHVISSFIKTNYSTIPIMVRQDIKLLFNDFSGFFITFLHLIIRENFKTPEELITYIQTLSTNDFLNLYLEGNETGLTIDSDKTTLDHILTDLSVAVHQDAKDKELFFEFIKYPMDIGSRFTHAMSVIYHDFFKPYEPFLVSKLDELILRHQALYDENPEAFINAILFQSKESLSDESADIHIYLSYFYGSKVSVAYSEHNKVYFFYGSKAEQKLYTKNLTDKYEELIKSLADETRRNLIRFLMHSPHYNKEISDHLGITTATISYHIGRLVELGIIKHKYQEGKRIYYQVDKERFDQLFDGLSRYLSSKEY